MGMDMDMVEPAAQSDSLKKLPSMTSPSPPHTVSLLLESKPSSLPNKEKSSAVDQVPKKRHGPSSRPMPLSEPTSHRKRPELQLENEEDVVDWLPPDDSHHQSL